MQESTRTAILTTPRSSTRSGGCSAHASFDGRDLFAHLARTLPAGHRAPALFLFAWKTWWLGHGALASVAVGRALDDDPDYSAARLLEIALAGAIDPRRMPLLELPG